MFTICYITKDGKQLWEEISCLDAADMRIYELTEQNISNADDIKLFDDYDKVDAEEEIKQERTWK